MKQPRGVDGAAGIILAASPDRRRPGRPAKYPAVVEFDCDGCGTRSSQEGWVYHRGTSPFHFCATCAHDGTANSVRAAARIAERRGHVAKMYPKLRPEAIAERLGVSEGTIHADVTALEQEGVLEKVPQWPAREHRVCALEGCDEVVAHDFPATVASGRGMYCSAKHAYAARRQRVLVTVKCKRKQCGLERELPRHEARKHPDFCGNSCSMRYRWEHAGEDLRGLAQSMHGRGKLVGRRAQQILGKIEGRKHGQRGGRPKLSATPQQTEEIRRLAAAGWGRRAIATRLRLSEWLVRTVLDA